MQVFQQHFTQTPLDLKAWEHQSPPDLLLCFGSKELLKTTDFGSVQQAFPQAIVAMASTAGEISNTAIADDSLVVTGVHFSQARVHSTLINIRQYPDSYQAGRHLMEGLPRPDLRFVLVLADGQLVNGSDLVLGINEALEYQIPVSGGLAGDGARFEETLVGLGQDIQPGNILAIGFYGSGLEVGYGSKGGWDEFGLTRVITRSEKNVLYEIDGESALDLYERYLGAYANELPGSALFFPLAIRETAQSEELVRTILSIDRAQKSMTFAGNVPTGAKVRLMKANLDNLVDAAAEAVEKAQLPPLEEGAAGQLSILISCVGRKLVFANRIEEEHEVARTVLGPATTITGFYSYGEIAPFSAFSRCELHNQTMTVTTIREK